MAKKREDRSSSDPTMRFDSPFAALAGKREVLPPAPSDDAVAAPLPHADADAVPFPSTWVVRIERAGRGGKTVTLLESPGLSLEAARAAAASIKRALGCGASAQAGSITLQGSLEDRAAAWLREQGAKKVTLGTRPRAGS